MKDRGDYYDWNKRISKKYAEEISNIVITNMYEINIKNHGNVISVS